MAKKDSSKQSKVSSKQQREANRERKEEAADSFEFVRLRNHFYRDGYRFLIGLSLLLAIIMTLFAITIYYMYTHRPGPVYFATNIQGQIIPLKPMDQPALSTAEILDWATRAASSAYTINYVQYRDQLQLTQDTYFTPGGAELFRDALSDAKLLDTINESQLIATAAVSQAPTINRQGVLPSGTYKGRYYWDLTMPLKVVFQNPGTRRSSNYSVRMVVVRSSQLVDNLAKNLDGAKGIGIASFLVKEVKRTGMR